MTENSEQQACGKKHRKGKKIAEKTYETRLEKQIKKQARNYAQIRNMDERNE